MGLSATQMRFLMVTARKTNVEYQGQQINQARTALANQSSALYTQLMDLQAPIAPSPYKFVITPATNPAIDWTEEGAYPLSEVDAKNFMIYYAGNMPNFQDFNIPVYEQELDADGKPKDSFIVGQTTDATGKVTYITKTSAELEGTTYAYRTKGKNSNGDDVSYTGLHVDNNAIYKYDPKTGTFGVKDGAVDANGNAYTIQDIPKWLQAYNEAMSYFATYSKPSKSAIYTHDEYDNLKDKKTEQEKQDAAVAFSSTATESFNQAQYNAAMAQYEEDLAEYERACDIINAKTEEIHSADKKLELQLKQLDTEQEAIQTEYEALKKVLEKNIENTFKTFG